MFFFSLYWYLILIVSVLCRLPLMFRLKKRAETADPAEAEAVRREACEVATRWTATRIKQSGTVFHVTGLENVPEGPVVFVCNHQSMFDIGVFLALIPKPCGFVAKTEILRIPLIRTWMRLLGCVFLDRGNIRQSAQTILEGINLVKAGHSMVIFPEGHRQSANTLGDFKAGAFKLATKSKAPLVPVSVCGTRPAFEANGWQIRYGTQPRVKIHPPLETKDMTKEEEIALPEKVKEIIQKGVNELAGK